MGYKNGKWKKWAEFIRYGFVGGSMTVFSFVLYIVMNEKLGLFYLFSNILSYSIAVVLSYFLNLWFTFKKKGVKIREFIQYIVMRVLFLGIDSIALFLCVQILGIDKYAAKILLTFTMLILTYTFSRKIFHQVSDKGRTE